MDQQTETPTRFEVVSPIRKDGERFKPGDPIDLAQGEEGPLLKAAAIKMPAVEETAKAPTSDADDELGETLDRLVSEGHEIDALKELSNADFETLSGLKVKKGDRVVALDLMIADRSTTDAITPIVDAITKAMDDEAWASAPVTIEHVRALHPAGYPDWTDEQITTAIAAFALTQEPAAHDRANPEKKED